MKRGFNFDMTGSIILILFGTGLFIFGISRFVESHSLKKNGIAVDATVVKTEIVRSPGGGDVLEGIGHYITFAYIVDGIKYKTQYNSDHVSEDPYYLTGEIIRIYCNKNNPDKIVISKDNDRMRSNIYSMLFGVILIAIGIYGIYTNP